MYLFLTLALVGWAVSMVLAALVIRGEKRARRCAICSQGQVVGRCPECGAFCCAACIAGLVGRQERDRRTQELTNEIQEDADKWQRAYEELEVEQHYQDWKARNES